MQARTIFSCRDRASYVSFMARHQKIFARIAAYEEARPSDQTYLERGRCAVCNIPSGFVVDHKYGWTDPQGRRRRNWRERLECRRCKLNSRMRAVMQLMLGNLGVTAADKVYVTEQVTPLFAALQARLLGVVGSEFLRDDTARGACNASGVRHEDITALSFPDNAFRCIGSFEVLEHVPDFQRGLAEFSRCLEPGGWLLLSTPFFPQYDRTLVRAVLAPDGTQEHLREPEFHGDPLSGVGVVCFYHFGWSLLDDLRAFGFHDPRVVLYWSRRYGYLGGLQPVIIARKLGRAPGLSF